MNNRDFEKICNLLPAGYTWGCSLTPDVALYIVNAALASQAQQPTKLVFDSESARQFLIESVLPKFSDRTFADYVRNKLAGDFAYQLAMYLQPQAQQEPIESEKAWCEWIATMIGAYLNEPVDSAKCKAIAGIIERRLWGFPKSQAQQTESQWISVEDQLPPRSTEVLVYPMLSAYSHVAWHDGDCWRVTEYEKYIGEVHTALSDGLITHWMVMPPAPEGE